MEQKRINRYKIDDMIGQGTTGIVYSGVDAYTGTRVAIKRLHKNLTQTDFLIDKFKAEANTLLMLNHPGIIRLMDLVISENGIDLVMQYAEGVSLAYFMSANRRTLNLKTIIQITVKILDILAYSHHKDIYHLDVKPSNIIINGDRIVMLDFGLTSLFNKNKKRGIEGTPAYMSPEQTTTGYLPDRRSDIFSVGIILYELLTGSRAFTNKLTTSGTFNSILTDELQSIQGYSKNRDAELNAIVQKAAKKEPHLRFQTCEEFMYHLNKIKS